jgi:hypothetical protein
MQHYESIVSCCTCMLMLYASLCHHTATLQALELGLQAVVVVNKIDRPSARPAYVVDKTFDLFCDLNANDMQSDFQVHQTLLMNSNNHHYSQLVSLTLRSILCACSVAATAPCCVCL